MSFTLRNATPEDIDDLLALWLEAAENDGRPADTQGAVAALLKRDPRALIVAADDDGELKAAALTPAARPGRRTGVAEHGMLLAWWNPSRR